VQPSGEGFGAASDRFGAGSFTAAKSVAPPPNHYDPIESTGGKLHGTFNRCILEGAPQRGRAKPVGFGSGVTRLKDVKKSVPGPGAYAEGLTKAWVKKSFNCEFGEVM
jgi:hypothetical protein